MPQTLEDCEVQEAVRAHAGRARNMFWTASVIIWILL